MASTLRRSSSRSTFAHSGETLRVKYIFTYSWEAASRIRITYSAWLTLYMTWICTYSKLRYS